MIPDASRDEAEMGLRRSSMFSSKLYLNIVTLTRATVVPESRPSKDAIPEGMMPYLGSLQVGAMRPYQ